MGICPSCFLLDCFQLVHSALALASAFTEVCFLLSCCLLLCCFSLSAFGCCSFCCSCFLLPPDRLELLCPRHSRRLFQTIREEPHHRIAEARDCSGSCWATGNKTSNHERVEMFPNAFKPMGGGGLLPWTTSDKACTTLLMLMMLATCAQHHQHHRVVASRFLLCISILRSPLLAFSYVGLGVCVSRSHCCLTSAR